MKKKIKTEYRNQKIDKPRIPKSKESVYLISWGYSGKGKFSFNG
jgi:hypothetical protein